MAEQSKWVPHGDPRIYSTPAARWEWPVFLLMEAGVFGLILWAVIHG